MVCRHSLLLLGNAGNRSENSGLRTDIANLDYFRATSVGGRSVQNRGSGDSGCAEELDYIATTPQFV
jgi:hypothetical protein